MISQTLLALIETQQKGHENEPLYMVGEQLKEIAEREPVSAELLEKDLATEGMQLKDGAEALRKYADKNHGKAKCFCITPIVAEKILREFYGLPVSQNSETEEKREEKNAFIDLDAFL